MTTPLAVVQALQSLKTAGDLVKILRDADAGLRGAELKTKIADLAEALADARLGMLDAQSEIERLNARVAELEAAKVAEAELEKRGNVYYRKSESGETGPFCVRCFEADRVLRSLARLPAVFNAFGQYTCPQCKKNF